MSLGDDKIIWVPSDGECRGAHVSARHTIFSVVAASARSQVEIHNTRRPRSVEALDVKDGIGVPVDAQFPSLFDRDVERLGDALR